MDVKWPLTQALSCHININNRSSVVPGAPGTWLLHWWPRTWSLSPSMFVQFAVFGEKQPARRVISLRLSVQGDPQGSLVDERETRTT